MTLFSSLLGVLCLIFSSSMEAAILKFLQVNTALIPGNTFYGKKAIMVRLYGVFKGLDLFLKFAQIYGAGIILGCLLSGTGRQNYAIFRIETNMDLSSDTKYTTWPTKFQEKKQYFYAENMFSWVLVCLRGSWSLGQFLSPCLGPWNLSGNCLPSWFPVAYCIHG
jgi:hypothetical protein